MTLERLLSFNRHSIDQDTWSRDRCVATRPEREPRILKERLFRLCQTCGNAPRMRVSRLTEPHLFSKEKSASPPRSLLHFNKVRAVSPLWRPHLFSILWLASWQNKRAAPLFPVSVASQLWSKFLFITLRTVFLHQVKVVSSLWRKLAPWWNSRAAFLQQREVCFCTSKSASLQQSESCISTSMFTSLQWIRVVFLLQTRSASPKPHDPRVYKTRVQSLPLQSVQTVHWYKQLIIFLGSIVHRQPAQSTDEV